MLHLHLAQTPFLGRHRASALCKMRRVVIKSSQNYHLIVTIPAKNGAMKSHFDLHDVLLHARRSSNADTGSTPSKKPQFRSIFISDVHLGTKDCKAKQLNAFLKRYRCENLYLVGDIFDGWKMRSGVYWNPSFNQFLRRLLKLSKRDVNIFYITGNHDEFLRKYSNNSFENIHLSNRLVHTTADNRRILVIHGDQFENVTRCSVWLKLVGDVGYEFLMWVNRWCNVLRAHSGRGYWSLSGYLKKHIQRAQTYIEDYENAVAYGAHKQGFDGVVCGHIHHPAQKRLQGVDYYNTGDWVESCTAVVETHDGKMQLLHWLDGTHGESKMLNPSTKAEGFIDPR